MRYDLSAIAYFNLPFIVLMMIPFAFRHHRYYERMLGILFVITNSILILLNLIDVIFYKFISKRTTTELHEFFFNPAENTGLLMQQFVVDFWYMFLIFILLLFIVIRFNRYFISQSPAPVRKFRWYLVQTIWFVFFAILTVVFARGGFQLKPIGLMSAAKYTESRNVPLLINSAFSILKTSGSKKLTERHFISDQELEKIFSPVHPKPNQFKINDTISFKNYNVVILILESLGSQYIGYYHPRAQSLTPFLDSLMNESIVFQGYANGKRSIEALPSILAGIPSLMPADYPSSPFVNNRIEGLGKVLTKQGYHTAFFHGGNNGTMGFDLFSKIAGFDHYYGRNEYGNDLDFDGQWGIFDEPFLQFVSSKLNQFDQPFAAGIFTLSSHHPYNLPKQFEGRFPHTDNEMEATFSYLDYSVKQFFKTIQSSDWFSQTIFVLTADHTPEKSNLSGDNFYEGLYEIPLAFFIPSHSFEFQTKKAQHIDILPSLAALLEIDQPIFSFGRNVFDTASETYVLNYMNGMYKLILNDTLVITNGDEIFELYDLLNDTSLKRNLVEERDQDFESELRFSQAVIQQYNNRMIRNRLYPE